MDFGKRNLTNDTSPEKIICAAIHWLDGNIHKYQPKNITSGLVVCGHRHHNIFVILSLLGRNDADEKELIQGFLTDTNRFVDRKEAMNLALKSGQIDEKVSILFSEDLY